MKKNIIQVSIDLETKNILMQEAKEKNLSLSSYIKLIISERKK